MGAVFGKAINYDNTIIQELLNKPTLRRENKRSVIGTQSNNVSKEEKICFTPSENKRDVPTNMKLPFGNKRFLVIDIDRCAFTYSSSLPELLSDRLITHAKNGKYDGFYVCTHRLKQFHTDSVDGNFYKAQQLEKDEAWFSKKGITLEKRNFYLSQIIKNFALKTGLPIVAVSTPDDCSETAPKNPAFRCGSGYKNIIEPFENDQLGIQTENKTKPTLQKPVFSFDDDTKNYLLIQIAQHAVTNFSSGMRTIILDYFDDRYSLCESATQIPNKRLPSNIAINIYLHGKNGNIKKIGVVKGEKKKSNSIFSLPNIKQSSGIENKQVERKKNNGVEITDEEMAASAFGQRRRC